MRNPRLLRHKLIGFYYISSIKFLMHVKIYLLSLTEGYSNMYKDKKDIFDIRSMSLFFINLK